MDIFASNSYYKSQERHLEQNDWRNEKVIPTKTEIREEIIVKLTGKTLSWEMKLSEMQNIETKTKRSINCPNFTPQPFFVEENRGFKNRATAGL